MNPISGIVLIAIGSIGAAMVIYDETGLGRLPENLHNIY